MNANNKLTHDTVWSTDKPCLFVDINILIDFFFLRNGEQNVGAIRTILESIMSGVYSAVVSFQSMTTLCYMMDKYNVPHEDAIRYLSHIADICTIYGGNNQTIRAWLTHQSDDIEDRFIYQCAIETSCTVLLTNNIKDFVTMASVDQSNQIDIYTPQLFLVQ